MKNPAPILVDRVATMAPVGQRLRAMAVSRAASARAAAA